MVWSESQQKNTHTLTSFGGGFVEITINPECCTHIVYRLYHLIALQTLPVPVLALFVAVVRRAYVAAKTCNSRY